RVHIGPLPQECPVTTPFTDDREHTSYDRAHAHDLWRALSRIEPGFQTFRSRFRGKCSPGPFFWGALGLAGSRFHRRPAPPRQAQAMIDRDAYDEEVISLGFWPGDPWTGAIEAMFYSYTVPAPPELPRQRVRPDAASFSDTLKEFVLPYDEVRRSPDPAAMILEFAQSTYDAGAELRGWDRTELAYPWPALGATAPPGTGRCARRRRAPGPLLRRACRAPRGRDAARGPDPAGPRATRAPDRSRGAPAPAGRASPRAASRPGRAGRARR